MICPKCGAEYRAGFSLCADCHVPLVTEGLKPEEADLGSEPETDDAMVQVLESMSPALVSDVVAAIERARIPYILESGTAFELTHRLAARKSYPEWRAYLHIPADFKDEFAKILDRVKSQQAGTPD